MGNRLVDLMEEKDEIIDSIRKNGLLLLAFIVLLLSHILWISSDLIINIMGIASSSIGIVVKAIPLVLNIIKLKKCYGKINSLNNKANDIKKEVDIELSNALKQDNSIQENLVVATEKIFDSTYPYKRHEEDILNTLRQLYETVTNSSISDKKTHIDEIERIVNEYKERMAKEDLEELTGISDLNDDKMRIFTETYAQIAVLISKIKKYDVIDARILRRNEEIDKIIKPKSMFQEGV